MESIPLTEDLSIKKLDPKDSKDVWLAKELDKDELIAGKNGYLWSIENELRDQRHLFREDIYNSKYSIYQQEKPIGYLAISQIFFCEKYVDIAYALLRQERGKGHATNVLREITEQILNDIINDVQRVILVIDPQNKSSQAVAVRCGFGSDGLTDEQHFKQGYVTYQKTKTMLEQERHLR